MIRRNFSWRVSALVLGGIALLAVAGCDGVEEAAKMPSATIVTTPFPEFPMVDLQGVRLAGREPDRFRVYRPYAAIWFRDEDDPDRRLSFRVMDVEYTTGLGDRRAYVLTGWAPHEWSPDNMLRLEPDFEVVGDYRQGRENETIRVYLGSDYQPDNPISDVRISGQAATMRSAEPYRVMMWDDLPLGEHEVRFVYNGEPYQAKIEILEAGGMLLFNEWDLRGCHGNWVRVATEAFPAADFFERPDGGVIRGGPNGSRDPDDTGHTTRELQYER